MESIRTSIALARFTVIAAILFCASREPLDAASFIKVIGTRTRTNVSNSSITVSVPSSGVAAGNSIVVAVHVGSLSGAMACSDPTNGAYRTDVVSASGGAAIAIASKHNIAALDFSELITCTYPVFSGASSMSAYEFSGLESGSPLDQTAQSGSTSGGAASSGLTAPTSQAAELVFGLTWLPNATQTFAPATSGGNPLENPYSPAWTQPFAAGTQKSMYRFVTAIRQYEANGTVGGTGGWIAQVATYRLAPDLCTGVACDDGNGCTIDGCDPATGLCSHAPEPVGIHCGDPSSGICDSSDRCDGAGVCLTNQAVDGTPCGEVDSDCEIAETCLEGVCHDNGVKPAGTACGDPSTSSCDAADTCTGTGLCQANLVADGTACGEAGTECVHADTCLSGTCQDNGFQAAGTACGDSSDTECSNPDTCTGGGSCQANDEAAGTVCGDPSSSQCDTADACDAAGVCASNHAANGTPCDDGETCTTADSCNASGQCIGVEDSQCLACAGNTAPVIAPAVVALPNDPMALGSGNVTVIASFTDAPGQTHSCAIDWNDESAPDAGVVAEPSLLDAGSCTGSHLYTATGVYTVTTVITDACGESALAIYRYAVVYDPTAGFVTGGGWIASPPGAYTPNPALTGKASFGFVSRYEKGNSKLPSGVTEFHFSVANFDFESSSYDWLVISGAKARFKGTGKVSGGGSYGFELTAWDGEASGGGGEDRFRISIWDLDHGDAVVYDNQIDSPGGDDPTTTLGGGNIVIHKK